MNMMVKLLLMSALVATTLAINLSAASDMGDGLTPALRSSRDCYKNRNWNVIVRNNASAAKREGIHARRAACALKKRPRQRVSTLALQPLRAPVLPAFSPQLPGASLFTQRAPVAAPSAASGWSAPQGPLNFGSGGGTGFNVRRAQEDLDRQSRAMIDEMDSAAGRAPQFMPPYVHSVASSSRTSSSRRGTSAEQTAPECVQVVNVFALAMQQQKQATPQQQPVAAASTGIYPPLGALGEPSEAYCATNTAPSYSGAPLGTLEDDLFATAEAAGSGRPSGMGLARSRPNTAPVCGNELAVDNAGRPLTDEDGWDL